MTVNDINFKYGNRIIFSNASLTIGTGLHYLQGPSGSGKSTLLYILHGLLNSSIKKNYTSSLMCQETYLIKRKRVIDLLSSISVKEEKISKYLKVFKINKDSYIKNLSLGQKQIVSFIICLLKDADMYLFDEPFANVDSINKRKMFLIIRKLSKEKCVIVASHKKITTALSITISNQKIIQNKSNENFLQHKYKNKHLLFHSPTIIKLAIFIFFVVISRFIYKPTYFKFDNYSNYEGKIENLYTSSYENIYDYNVYYDTSLKDGAIINDVLHIKYNVNKGDYVQTYQDDKFKFYEVKDIVTDEKLFPSIYVPGSRSSFTKNTDLLDNYKSLNYQVKKINLLSLSSLILCIIILEIILSELFIKKYLFLAILRGKTSIFSHLFVDLILTSLPLLFIPYSLIVISCNFAITFIIYFYLYKRFVICLRNNI